jgi:hypothetical protein
MNDFLAVDQLLSTLAIGFVILGYSEFFINVLKTKFFHAEDKITEVCKECSSAIPDKTTRDNLKPIQIEEGSTASQIEQLKISCEKIEKNIKQLQNDANENLKKNGELRSLAASCLFVFLFSVTLLFLPGVKNVIPQQFHVFIFSFSIFCIIYTIVGEIFGEVNEGKLSIWFSSLSKTVISFFIIFFISGLVALLSIWVQIEIGCIWKYLYVSLILLGWINFIVYAFIIRCRIISFKDYVDLQKECILKECNRVQREYDDLKTVAKMADRFTAKNK